MYFYHYRQISARGKRAYLERHMRFTTGYISHEFSKEIILDHDKNSYSFKKKCEIFLNSVY